MAAVCGLGRRTRQLLAESSDQALGASVMTLGEALVAPARAGRLDEAQTALYDLAVRPIELNVGAAASLALLRAETGLRMPDCCVLHAAAMTGAETIATFDERLARIARRRGLTTPEGAPAKAGRDEAIDRGLPTSEGKRRAAGQRLLEAPDMAVPGPDELRAEIEAIRSRRA